MASLSENISIIRSEGIYGTDIREAIAQAIEQSDSYVDEKIKIAKQTIQGDICIASIEPIVDGDAGDCLLSIRNVNEGVQSNG